MQHRVLLAMIGGACFSLVACNQEKKEASPEPATTITTPATATTTEAPAKAEETDKAGAAQPSTAENTDKAGDKTTAGSNTPTTTVANGEKSVKADGTNLGLKNESGKGGVTTQPGGGVKVTGKSGKSIAVPGL
jgi:hypothetical protein